MIKSSTLDSQAPSRLSYSISEAATVIGIGRTKLYDLIKDGSLPVVKLGHRTLVRHDDLDRLVRPSPAS